MNETMTADRMITRLLERERTLLRITNFTLSLFERVHTQCLLFKQEVERLGNIDISNEVKAKGEEEVIKCMKETALVLEESSTDYESSDNESEESECSESTIEEYMTEAYAKRVKKTSFEREWERFSSPLRRPAGRKPRTEPILNLTCGYIDWDYDPNTPFIEKSAELRAINIDVETYYSETIKFRNILSEGKFHVTTEECKEGSCFDCATLEHRSIDVDSMNRPRRLSFFSCASALVLVERLGCEIKPMKKPAKKKVRTASTRNSKNASLLPDVNDDSELLVPLVVAQYEQDEALPDPETFGRRRVKSGIFHQLRSAFFGFGTC